MECEIYGRVQIYTGKVDFFYWTMYDVFEFTYIGRFLQVYQQTCKMRVIVRCVVLYMAHEVIMRACGSNGRLMRL